MSTQHGSDEYWLANTYIVTGWWFGYPSNKSEH